MKKEKPKRINYFKMIFWIISIQWQEPKSRSYLIWMLTYTTLKGFQFAIIAYALAQVVQILSEMISGQTNCVKDDCWLKIPQEIYFLFGIILIVQIFFTATGRYADHNRRRMQVRFGEAFFRDLLTKVYSLNQEQLEDKKFSILFDRAHEGIRTVWTIIGHLASVLTTCVSLLVALVVLFLASPWASLVVLLSLIPIILMQRQIGLKEEALKREVSSDWRAMYGSSYQLINRRYMIEIRLLNAFKQIAQKWKESGNRIEQSYSKTIKEVLPLDVISSVINPIVGFTVSLYFVYMLVNSLNNPGIPNLDLAWFLFLQSNLRNTLASSTDLSHAFQALHRSFIDLNNFIKIRETKPIITDGKIKIKSPLTVELKNVSFKYPQSEKYALEDISLKIDNKDHLALVGSNGAGKTTLLKLIMRQYLPTSGQIKVNGYSIEDLNLDHYYSLVSHLGQEFFLSGELTIKENLLLGVDRPLPNKSIQESLNLAECQKFVNNLPLKLSSRVDPTYEDGIELSTGQRQRICVARSLLKQASLLILDEPTSAIDAKAESRIFNNIYSNQTDKSILAISHRFSTVRRANKILVMDKGKIVERGSHKQLMRKNGLYKEVFEIQAEGYRG